MKSMVTYLSLVTLALFNVHSYCQIKEWEWANIIDCNYTYNMSPVIGTDNYSNVYITDNYGLSANFGDTVVTSTDG